MMKDKITFEKGVYYRIRLLAKAIDLFIVLILSFFLYPLGVTLSLFYLGVSDSIHNGQSVGKRVLGFSVVSVIDGNPCTLKQSIIRNLPLLIPLFFALFHLWGIIFSLILGIPLIAMEIYLFITLDTGNRLGDVMADTTVIAMDNEKELLKKRKMSWFQVEISRTPRIHS